MKHVILIETECRVVGEDRGQLPINQAEPEGSLDEMVAAIDRRANYVGPVLEHLLQLDHETWPGILRE